MSGSKQKSGTVVRVVIPREVFNEIVNRDKLVVRKAAKSIKRILDWEDRSAKMDDEISYGRPSKNAPK